MTRSVAYREAGGRIDAPASKSSMQRATACALLAGGEGAGEGGEGTESVLRSPSRSADCLAALGVARALGAEVEDRGDSFAIRGIGAGLAADIGRRGHGGGASAGRLSVSCGESGLCLRMFSPVAALFGSEIELGAEGTLRKRPVSMIEAPLRELGAECSTAAGLPPVRLRGPLRGGRARVDGSESSQFLTGLLVALPIAAEDSVVEVEGLASRGYVDLTMDTMRAFGVEAERDSAYSRFSIRGRQRYRAADFQVEGDWSGAAFLLVAGAIAGRGDLAYEGVVVDKLDSRSSQPDRAVIDALAAAGAAVERRAGSGGREGIAVRRGALGAFEFDASDCPDLFPPLVALAAACEGESLLRGALRLRAKESDRAAALSEEFGKLGARVTVEGDLMRVAGAGAAAGGRLAGGRIDSRGDHRIAMAAAVASLLCSSPVEIEGAECVAKSWPVFFEDLAKIAR
jgi:3-phosphoshikimate 1-carboxyvinyltransferase